MERNMLLNLVLAPQHKKEAKDRKAASDTETPPCLGSVPRTQVLNKDTKTGSKLSSSNFFPVLFESCSGLGTKSGDETSTNRGFSD